MSAAFDALLARVKAMEEEIRGLRRENYRSGVVHRDEVNAAARVDRGTRVLVDVPLSAFAAIPVALSDVDEINANTLLGRGASAGVPEEITCTAAGRALLDDAAASDQRTTLGLGTIATQAASAVAITGGTITGLTDMSATHYEVAGTQVVGAQGAAVADATDAASTMARLNDLLARCRAHGLIAT